MDTKFGELVNHPLGNTLLFQYAKEQMENEMVIVQCNAAEKGNVNQAKSKRVENAEKSVFRKNIRRLDIFL